MQRTLTLSTEAGYTLFVGPRGSGVTTAALKLATLTQPLFMIVGPTAAACRWATCIAGSMLVWHPGCEAPFTPLEQLVVICEAHEFTQEQIDPILKLCAARNVDVWLEGHAPTEEMAGWWAELLNTGRPVGEPPRAANPAEGMLQQIADVLKPWQRPGENLAEAVRRLNLYYEDLIRQAPAEATPRTEQPPETERFVGWEFKTGDGMLLQITTSSHEGKLCDLTIIGEKTVCCRLSRAEAWTVADYLRVRSGGEPTTALGMQVLHRMQGLPPLSHQEAIDALKAYMRRPLIPPPVLEERFDFSMALRAIKQGKKVCRAGWNGKGMWLRHFDPICDKEFRIREQEPCEGTWLPFIVMKTVDNKIVPWLASQTDLLADDWEVVS